MILSAWKPKPNIKDSVTSSDQSVPLEKVVDYDIYKPGDNVCYKWIFNEIRTGTVINIGLSIIIEDHVTGNIWAVIFKDVVGSTEIQASSDDRVTTEIHASSDDRVTTEIHASPDDRLTTEICASPDDRMTTNW